MLPVRRGKSDAVLLDAVACQRYSNQVAAVVDHHRGIAHNPQLPSGYAPSQFPGSGPCRTAIRQGELQ